MNVGYSPHSLHDTLVLVRHYRDEVCARPGLELAGTIDEVRGIAGRGDIAVAFDLEVCRPRNDNLANRCVGRR